VKEKENKNKHTMSDLLQMQSLPLSAKISMTLTRIRAWYDHFDGQVYVSFSGGKDSTVLVDILSKHGYGDVPLVFVDTGLEYPEIREFVKGYGDRVTWLRPKMNFKKVIETYGYPLISKDVSQCISDVRTYAKNNNCDMRKSYLWDRAFNPDSEYAKKYPHFSRTRWDFLLDSPFLISHKCCDAIKKRPSKEYEKETGRKPILAIMASESRQRTTQWLKVGCNAFEGKRPISKPMSFWTEQDVLQYIKENDLPICSVYGDVIEDIEGTEAVEGQMTMPDIVGWEDQGSFDAERPPLKTTGCDRTGCMFCMFGCGTASWNNFERMKQTHPKQYEWIMKPWSEGGLGYKEVIDWMNSHGNLNIRY